MLSKMSKLVRTVAIFIRAWDWKVWEGRGGGTRDTGLVAVDNLFENPARCMYVRMYVCVNVYVCMYVCIFYQMCVCVCMYICMYVCIHECNSMHACIYENVYVFT